MGCRASKNKDSAEMDSIVVKIQGLAPAKSRKASKKTTGMKTVMQNCFRNKKKQKDKISNTEKEVSEIKEIFSEDEEFFSAEDEPSSTKKKQMARENAFVVRN